MKITSSVLSIIVSALSILAIVSCNQTPASSAYEVKAEQNSGIIASLDINSVGSVEFIETEPGCLVTTGTFSSMDAVAPYKGLNPVELYKALSGSDAPASLLAAYQRAMDAAKTESDVPPPPDFKNDELITDVAALAKTKMDANQFVSTYCMGIGTMAFGTCQVDQTGPSSYTHYATQLYTYAHAKQGSIRFMVQSWNGSAWVTIYNKIVAQGTTGSYTYSGANKYFKMSVSEALGRVYHYCYMGK